MTTVEKIKYLTGITSQGIEKDLRPYQRLLPIIDQYFQAYQSSSDTALQQLSRELIKKAKTTKEVENLLPEAFALVKEVCRRQLDMIPYDVQLIGGMGLHRGKIIEMKTGEGKTLAAVMPVYLNALTQKGVHVLTFNDYLAKRDAEWMKPVYEFLGLSVGYIQQGMSATAKRNAYACDITYATAKEVGFDYLRQFMAYDKSEIVLRPFHFAIVDEADALMIDEARNPLVLAGNLNTPLIDYHEMATLITDLKKEEHYQLDEAKLNTFLTEKGQTLIEKKLNINDLYANENYDLLSAINLALHAKVFLTKDIDYVVLDGKVKLVDEFTGRIVEDRKWRNGLQTAVEAKEKLQLQSEGNILNAISLQHFLKKYPKLAGMTATAQSSAEEFLDFYELKIVVIPPNKTCIRVDHDDVVFATKPLKTQAILHEVKRVHATGQPILIGTLTVKESEELAILIKNEGINCQVLNAKNNEKEAQIVANAGKFGAVTISTNMAGRGTDIKLGGVDEAERKEVIKKGGLYVLGTNRHESKRIDLQLKGRAGRQGDVGESRFFVSFEDDLLKRYDFMEILPQKLHKKIDKTQPIAHGKILQHIDVTQHIIENRFMDMRRNLMEYTHIIELQRNVLQSEGRQLFLNDQYLKDYIDLIVEEVAATKLSEATLTKIKKVILFYYDKYWAALLSDLTAMRENIHFVRLGGQIPLREFRKISKELFDTFLKKIESDIEELIFKLIKNPALSLEEFGYNRPSSTWTYIINDNPYGNQLAVMLLQTGNIGFTADPISATLLFFKALWDKRKS